MGSAGARLSMDCLTEERHPDSRGQATGSAAARPPVQQVDDWLGEISDDDWNESAGERPAGRPRGDQDALEVPYGDDSSSPWADDRSRPSSSTDAGAARSVALRRRRLAAVLVVASALVIVTGIAVVILRGGDSAPTTSAAEPLTPSPEQTEADTSPTPTTPTPAETPETPAATGASAPPTTPTATDVAFTLPAGTKLRRGDEADPAVVTALQQALQAAGYDPGPIDGTYGRKTVQAVTAFQQATGLTADGVVGTATAAALKNVRRGAQETSSFALPAGTKLRRGEEADPAVVTALQQALQAAGYDPGPIDGTYGRKTVQAVTAFQQATGLTADGVVGTATASALNDAASTG